MLRPGIVSFWIAHFHVSAVPSCDLVRPQRGARSMAAGGCPDNRVGSGTVAGGCTSPGYPKQAGVWMAEVTASSPRRRATKPSPNSWASSPNSKSARRHATPLGTSTHRIVGTSSTSTATVLRDMTRARTAKRRSLPLWSLTGHPRFQVRLNDGGPYRTGTRDLTGKTTPAHCLSSRSSVIGPGSTTATSSTTWSAPTFSEPNRRRRVFALCRSYGARRDVSVLPARGGALSVAFRVRSVT